MKKKANILNTFVRSIYDVSSFSISARRGLKRAIIYMLLLTIILGGIKGIFLGRSYYNQIYNISDILQKNYQNMYIKDNELSIDNAPIMFKDIDKLLLYVNDDKTVTDKLNDISESTYNNSNLLILKDGIIYEDFKYKYTLRYSDILDGNNIDNDIIQAFMRDMRLILPIIIVVTDIATSLIDLLIDYLIIVIIASLISLFMKMVIRYRALLALTIYASTLPLIIVTVLGIIRPWINFKATFIVGTLTYLVIIFKNIKAEIIERFSKKGL